MKQLQISKLITNREGQSVEKYLQEISRVALLTPNEEVELCKRIQNGESAALVKLTKANLRFVVSVAKNYQNYGMPLSDLINEGNVGLIKAGQRFDDTRGFRFISYAIWWIRQAIMYAIASQSRTVRLPFNRMRLVTQISKTYSKLEQEFEREPTLEELADVLNITAAEVRDTINASGRYVSMNAPLNSVGKEENCLVDMLENKNGKPPDSDMMVDSLRREISKALCTLSRQESAVTTMYFGLNCQEPIGLEEIGTRLSLTRGRVRQIKDNAIQRLRCNEECKSLKFYLG